MEGISHSPEDGPEMSELFTEFYNRAVALLQELEGQFDIELDEEVWEGLEADIASAGDAAEVLGAIVSYFNQICCEYDLEGSVDVEELLEGAGLLDIGE